MKNLLILIFFVFKTVVLFGQNKNIDRSRELKVGSELPVIKKAEIINYMKEEYDFQNTKGKVIILDFFNTGCVSCIENMPKLKRLSEEFGENIEIIMVTFEDKVRVEKFYENSVYLKENNSILPTIVSDSLLIKYFPHNAVSHTVWIYNNMVKAISHPDYVDKGNIRKILNGDDVSIPLKDDFNIFELLSSEMKNVGNVKKIRDAEITGFNSQLNSTGLKFSYDTIMDCHVTYINNNSIMSAFTSSWAHLKVPEYFLLKERVEWNVKNKDRYFFDKGNSLPFQKWKEEFAICYKAYNRLNISDSLGAKQVIDNLSDFFGIDVTWEMRNRLCLVLKNGKRNVSQLKIDGVFYQGTKALAMLMDYSEKYPPVIDEANYIGNIIIPEFKNLKELNIWLEYYGLEIVEEYTNIEVLVFRER